MAKIILGNWIGYKYVYINKCPVTELQDYIVLKLIQKLGCRLNSPKKPSINLASGHECDSQREELYNEINGTNAPIISTHDTYTEQQKIIRKNWENDKLSNLRYSVAHWEKTDPNIHKFLKDFSKIC